MWQEFEETRTAILTFDNGSRVRAELSIPPNNYKWHNTLEHRLVDDYNKRYPFAKHKVVKIHLMRH